ncbi:unnamed protein product [Rhodiola kirilowii]
MIHIITQLQIQQTAEAGTIVIRDLLSVLQPHSSSTMPRMDTRDENKIVFNKTGLALLKSVFALLGPNPVFTPPKPPLVGVVLYIGDLVDGVVEEGTFVVGVVGVPAALEAMKTNEHRVNESS